MTQVNGSYISPSSASRRGRGGTAHPNLFEDSTIHNPYYGDVQQNETMNMHPIGKPAVLNPIHPSIVDKLDPAFIKLYNDFIANGPPPSSDLNVVRDRYSALYRFAQAPATGVGGIGETTVPGWDKYPGEVSVRVYVPPGEETGQRKVWPVHFNFHGGGWAVGDLETSAHICHHICANVPCCVIDIDYRKIPEYPFPIGIMDGLSAVAHILVNHKTFSIDPQNITLGGDSSGATIALILNHMFRDTGGAFAERLKAVVVGTPTISDVRKYSTPSESPWLSMRESEFAPLLDWQKLKWFDTFKWMSLSSHHPSPSLQQPVGTAGGSSTNGTTTPRENSTRPSRKEQQADLSWFANAMNAPSFEDLAPLTWIGTAEFDPLRDEAEAYGLKCQQAGNNVTIRRFQGVPHPFMHMDGVLKQGQEYVGEVITHIRTALYPNGVEASNTQDSRTKETKEVTESNEQL